MIHQRNYWLWFKINGLLRWGLVHGIVPIYGNVVVTEYPKSGGTWIVYMLSEAIDIPFPRNRLPLFKRQLLHGHYLYSPKIEKPVVVIRDVRDVVVSQYFRYFIPNGRNDYLVQKIRAKVPFDDYDDIQNNLSVFIRYLFEKNITKFTWSQFVRSWIDKEAIFTSYEAFKADAVDELIRLVKLLDDRVLPIQRAASIVEKYSFEKVSGRKAGEEDRSSFYRKGIVGDWKNYFDERSKELIKKYAGEELIMLGYERDLQW